MIAANVWVGASPTSRIHVDAHDNLLCVARGAKVVHLYSPFRLDLLVLGPSQRPPVESRLRSLLFHTGSTWPRGFARVVAHVQAGEALFIPAGWAHEMFTVAAPTPSPSLWCAPVDPQRIRLRPTLLHLASGGRFGDFVAAAAGANRPREEGVEKEAERRN